jgi:molybdopterin-guanine dinucleotide biosynthesis protein
VHGHHHHDQSASSATDTTDTSDASSTDRTSSSGSTTSTADSATSATSFLDQLIADLQQLDSDLTDGIGGDTSSGTTTAANGSGASNSFFQSIDSNGDGSVSKAEWEQARPPGVSQDEADAQFSKIDTTNSGSISASQLQTAFQDGTIGAPPQSVASSTGTAGTSTDSSGTGSQSDLTQGLNLAQLMQAIQSYMSSSVPTSDQATTTALSTLA